MTENKFPPLWVGKGNHVDSKGFKLKPVGYRIAICGMQARPDVERPLIGDFGALQTGFDAQRS
jgi:hypothetical protein